jgi:FemAB-related protein (PEP-CTERM system-associated)
LKGFFFEKKKQKTFISWCTRPDTRHPKTKSFLVLFFKKEPLMLKIRPLANAGHAWDAFVNSRPDATFFHLSAWRQVIEQAFGHRAYYVMAEQDGAIVGILPLAQVKTRLFGHTLISTPFCVYGGPLAVDAEASRALADHAAGLRATLGATAVEFRYLQAPADDFLDQAWQTRGALYVTFRRAISGDDDVNLKSIPRKQRAVVRKAMEHGLCARADHDVDTLHGIYARSVRNLGTPVFARRYFRLLAEIFRANTDVITVSEGDTPIASVLNFYFRDEVIPYYGGGTQAARACGGNDFMYWEVMRRAAGRGCRLFDFGRSKTGTGAFAFKKNFGFTPLPLAYRVRVASGAAIPEINPLNPKYRLMIAAWKRLPLPVANLLGPMLVRGTG